MYFHIQHHSWLRFTGAVNMFRLWEFPNISMPIYAREQDINLFRWKHSQRGRNQYIPFIISVNFILCKDAWKCNAHYRFKNGHPFFRPLDFGLKLALLHFCITWHGWRTIHERDKRTPKENETCPLPWPPERSAVFRSTGSISQRVSG